MDPLTEEEVTEDVDYANVVADASSTTVRDIQNLSKRKASVTALFANMLVIIKCFVNLFNTILGICFTLLIHLHNYVITPLVKFSNNANNQLAASSRLTVMWLIYQQSKNFCRGQM